MLNAVQLILVFERRAQLIEQNRTALLTVSFVPFCGDTRCVFISSDSHCELPRDTNVRPERTNCHKNAQTTQKGLSVIGLLIGYCGNI
jgi:hypothetical protein